MSAIIWTSEDDHMLWVAYRDEAEVGVVGGPGINLSGTGFRAVTLTGPRSMVRDFSTLQAAQAWIKAMTEPKP